VPAGREPPIVETRGTALGRFRPGDTVRVLEDVRGGNPRTPRYLRGWMGIIVRCHGRIPNPLDHRGIYPPLFSVRFRLHHLRSEVVADLHEEWLAPVGVTEAPQQIDP
jgi:hypothetical protein